MTFEERRPSPSAASATRQLPTLAAASSQAPAEWNKPEVDQEAAPEHEGVMALGPGSASSERATGPVSPWRKSGKLVGNPPIRDEKDVPNINIGESEKNYKTLFAGARSLLKGQRDRADAMLSKDKKKVLDYRFWFARVYSYVTEEEIRYCEERTFDYPSYVMQCVLNFDKIYADNLEATGSKVEPHWKAAFKTADHMEIGDGFPTDAAGIVFSLVASMLAHIRFDLPRAEAWVAESYGQKYGAKPSDFKADFFRMSGVFDIAGRKMFGDIRTLLGDFTLGRGAVEAAIWGDMTDGAMRWVMGADMGAERLATWRRMTELVGDDLTPKNPYTLKDGKLTGDVTKTPAAGIGNLGKIEPQSLRPTMQGIEPDPPLERYARTIGGAEAWGLPIIQDIFVGNEFVELHTKTYLNAAQREKMVADRHATMLLQLIHLYSKGFEPDVQQLVMLALKTARAQGDLVMVVNMVDVFTLVKAFPISQRRDITDFLIEHYYENLEPINAANLIIKWDALGSGNEHIRLQIRSIYSSLSPEKKTKTKRILSEENVKLSYLR